jgi:hypothetical protein
VKHTSLRELLEIYRLANERAEALFEHASSEINRELRAVGGRAITSPNAGGYCTTFNVTSDGRGWGYGATSSSSSLETAVGDRCDALTKAHHVAANEVVSAGAKIEERVRTLLGKQQSEGIAAQHVELVSRALLLDDENV